MNPCRISYKLFAVAVLCSAVCSTAFSQDSSNWASWRGPLHTGAAPDATPPLTWSEEENVRWKTPLVGEGHSTPVVWNDRIFLTAAVPVGDAMEPKMSGAPGAHDNRPITHKHEFRVIAINRSDGNVVWEKTVHSAIPHEGAHNSGTLASASPITDGKSVFACFGSYGLYCLDFDGNVRWQKDFGRMNTKHGHGEGATPALHDDTLIVNWDHEGDSFIVALDKHDGDQRWKVERNEVTSWSSPIVVEHEGLAQVIVAGTQKVRAYNLKDGKVIWECGGLSHNIVATPVSDGKMVFVGSSYEIRSMIAIRLAGAKGDITTTDNVVWRRTQLTPYVPSMLLYKGTLYFLRHYQGVLSRVVSETGEEVTGPLRLDGIGDIYASPVAADDRVYITDREGVTIVISHGEIPRALALNRLDDRVSASLALAGDEIFVRGEEFLYCIAEE